MSERLGEMLLHVGTLTEEQLEQVLSAQSVYGGKIGTNLVEMGLLSEDDLARLLNEKLGVPCVEASSLANVPASLIAILPLEMAQRFQALPVALDGKRLTLAMTDPGNFVAIDEIGFFTGLVIVPRVCSELRFTMALERYYGIKRVLNFIPVEGGSRTRAHNIAKDWMEAPVVSNPPVSDPGNSSANWLAPSPENIFHQSPGSSLNPGDTGSASLIPGQESEQGSGFDSSHGLTAESRTGSAGSADCAVIDPLHNDMKSLAADFAGASGDAEVVTLLMSYLRDNFNRAGFLSLRRGSAGGVQAVAEGAAVPTFLGWVINLEGAARLKGVLEKREPYLGMLTEAGAEGQILDKIGGEPGGAALLLPLVITGASVAFILVSDARDRLVSGLFDLQRVVAKAGLAFEMLSIRKKIVQA